MNSGDQSDKRNWRERLGIGARDMPKLSEEFKVPSANTEAAMRPSQRPDTNSAQFAVVDPLAAKLRAQRAEAEKLAEQLVQAARERQNKKIGASLQTEQTATKALAPGSDKEQIQDEAQLMNDDKTITNKRSIFVIHGRNVAITESMNSFLRAVNLKPIEFSSAVHKTIEEEKHGGNPTIGRILDRVFEKAEVLLVLLTPDDQVTLRSELWGKREKITERKPSYQPRPNVLFEAGLAIGRHPDKTILVTVGDVKPFSDIAGIHMVHLDNSSKMRRHLAIRLQKMGCAVELDGDDWENVGSFQALKKAVSRK